MQPIKIDPKWYRQVLGQYPTGVCVVTARNDRAEPIAMVVGSFTSVSLDPPLIAFFPDRGSSSWAKLRGCDAFCVNIMAADQEDVCRKLASKDPDKFVGVAHRLSPRGNPVLEDVVAWIECERYSITDAGDHEMVLGQVLELDIAGTGLPLLFFQGGYGRFSHPEPVAAPPEQTQRAGTDMDLDKRLQRLEARAAINDRVVDYFLAADGDDLDGVAASFTESASFRSSGALVASGRQGIADFIRGARRQMGLTVHTPHYVHLTFDGDDAAAGLVGAHLELAFGDATLFGAVRYVDRYVREEGQWLISARDMRVIHMAPWLEVGTAFASATPVRWIGAPPAASDFPRKPTI